MIVRDLMSEDPLTLTTDSSFELAEKFMGFAHVRHLPVVDPENRVVGLVTHRDLLRASVSLYAGLSTPGETPAKSIPISRIMRSDVTTVSPGLDVRDAARMMYDKKFGCLLVTEDSRLIGIVTEADFLKLTLELLNERRESTAP